MILSVALFLFFWNAPLIFFVLEHGRFPGVPYTNSLKRGLSKEEVESIAGKPHKVSHSGNRELWIYYSDPFGLNNFYIQLDENKNFDYCFNH